MNASQQNSPASLARFWQPRYWPLWLGVATLRALVMLPFRVQLRIGALLGRLLFLVMPERRRIAAVNLRLCFPELSEAERQGLLRRHFASLGIGFFELGNAWWASDERIASLVRFEGLDHLTTALGAGRGALVLSGHFSGSELTGRAVCLMVPTIGALYRPNRNALIDELLRRARSRATQLTIPKDNVRSLLRALKQGIAVWYAPDQSYRRQHSVLVPFFGEPAMTNGALTPIARLSNSPVVPYFPRRLADGSGYQVTFLPALENFPSGDTAVDASRINALIEAHIREAPEQYYWVHRRFKGRPAGYPDPYASG
jgi:KDO2-lipid IV(A) lauroyltransferase